VPKRISFILLFITIVYMISRRGGPKTMQAGVAFVARLIDMKKQK
jgi:hypothetical protein